MTTEPNLPAELQENLVAYLDGELGDVATQEIERTLAENSTLREEVEVLTRSFEMLDELPRPQLSSEFTERTIATIQLSQPSSSDAGEEEPTSSWPGRRSLIAGWLLGLAASVALGLWIGGQVGSDDSDRLIEDLPLLKNLDTYREVEDIEYLRKLNEQGLFNDRE